MIGILDCLHYSVAGGILRFRREFFGTLPGTLETGHRVHRVHRCTRTQPLGRGVDVGRDATRRRVVDLCTPDGCHAVKSNGRFSFNPAASVIEWTFFFCKIYLFIFS